MKTCLAIFQKSKHWVFFFKHFLLREKQILQRLCEKNLKWDTKLPEDLQTEWKKWKIKLPALQEVQTKRRFMPPQWHIEKLIWAHNKREA